MTSLFTTIKALFDEAVFKELIDYNDEVLGIAV